MERNLDRRIEATTPVTDPALVDQLVDVLERNFADDRFTLGARSRPALASSRAVAGSQRRRPS